MKETLKNNSIYIVALVILIAIGLYLRYQAKDAPLPEMTEEIKVTTDGSISIESKEIDEKNFGGRVAVISGDSSLAVASRKYIDETVAEFKKQADTDVPEMIEQFGADNPVSKYELAIEAELYESEDTKSIAMSTYIYNGGAHGNSSYKVISASSTSGEILSLGDIIKKDKQDEFVSLLKKSLLDWRPYETTDTVVFTEEVEGIQFDSLTNWSLDDKNLIVYFSQYEIGPGVLGPVAFPISLDKIKDFLK